MFNANSGQRMKQMVKEHLGPVSHGSASYEQPSTLSPQESQRNYKITAWLNSKNFMGNVVTRLTYPHDKTGSQQKRELEWFRQASMPWGDTFMKTPTDPQRLNNPQQQAFVKQRQLTIPDSYGQFYAFMHALSAAFGNLSQGK
jgi:hypothetical protein